MSKSSGPLRTTGWGPFRLPGERRKERELAEKYSTPDPAVEGRSRRDESSSEPGASEFDTLPGDTASLTETGSRKDSLDSLTLYSDFLARAERGRRPGEIGVLFNIVPIGSIDFTAAGVCRPAIEFINDGDVAKFVNADDGVNEVRQISVLPKLFRFLGDDVTNDKIVAVDRVFKVLRADLEAQINNYLELAPDPGLTPSIELSRALLTARSLILHRMALQSLDQRVGRFNLALDLFEPERFRLRREASQRAQTSDDSADRDQ